MVLWLASVLVSLVIAPASAAVAWLVVWPLTPAIEAMGWTGLRSAAYEAGLLLPPVLALAGYPLTRLLASRYGLRALGAHDPAPVAADRRLLAAAQRVGRRQAVHVELALLPVEWLGVTTIPAAARPDVVVVAVPGSAAGADDEALDRLLTPPVHLARRRPAERMHRLAALAPIVVVHAFWRTLRWNRRRRLLAAVVLSVVGLTFIPAGIPPLERLLAAPVIGMALAAALAALWAGRTLWARVMRTLGDVVLGEPGATVTEPAWVLDLRDHDTDGSRRATP